MSFHPVVLLPTDYEIFDFSKGYDKNRLRGVYGIGRYDEDRSGMYTTNLFSPGSPEARTIHVGIDIGAPAGTAVFAFDDGEVYLSGINDQPGDYGGTLITRHQLAGRDLWALHGHLAHSSVSRLKAGAPIKKGEQIATLGSEHENGGWNPHLHFQLSWKKPVSCDLPGVVSLSDRSQALLDFPDPRLVLGPLY